VLENPEGGELDLADDVHRRSNKISPSIFGQKKAVTINMAAKSAKPSHFRCKNKRRPF